MHRQSLGSNAEKASLSEDSNINNVGEEIISDYKQLNDKCDQVITKIKTRKNNKKK